MPSLRMIIARRLAATRRRRMLSVATAVLATAGALVLTSPTAASAHDATLTYWGGISPVLFARGQGYALQSHTLIRACDRNADGLGVRVWYFNNLGWDYVGDGNGSASGCGERRPAGGAVGRFQVCVGPIETESCTAINTA